jgi:multiple sugar transport system ATP-binding protein
LVQLGTPRQIYEDPASAYVAQRLGSPRINLLPRSALPGLAAPAATHTVGLRAEHLRLLPARGAAGGEATGGAIEATVQRIERLSDQTLVLLSLAGSELTLTASPPPGSAVEHGDAVHLQVQRSLWFDADGMRIRA